MKLLSILILLCLVHNTVYPQQDFIDWNKNVKIDWTDFGGKVDASSPYSAMSAIGIHYKYNSWSNGVVYKLTFEINSRFDKTRSWSKRFLESNYTLKHEQLHFDIAELVSRKFKSEVESTVFSKDYKNETVQIFNKHMQVLQQLQQRYDEETEHSRNKRRQKDWENIIHQALKE